MKAKVLLPWLKIPNYIYTRSKKRLLTEGYRGYPDVYKIAKGWAWHAGDAGVPQCAESKKAACEQLDALLISVGFYLL